MIIVFVSIKVPESRLQWGKLNSRKKKFLCHVKSAFQLKRSTILFNQETLNDGAIL